jgi:hypothetical protein
MNPTGAVARSLQEPGMKHGIVFALALAALALAGSPRGGEARAEDQRPSEIPYATPGEAPQLSPDYRMTTHKVVLITDQGLNPRVATLSEGQLVAWISYSASSSVVVFEREVARNMICHSLVNFHIADDELRSAPIHAGEFASFCQLKPGRYRYKVVRTEGLEQDDARRRLEGEIIVGNPE